jgi:hypothetical protein
MEATLAALGNRVFLMNNVHDDAPVVFESRWAMSYLCGPLTKNQIKTLMDPVRSKHPSAKAGDGAAAATIKPIKAGAAGDAGAAAPSRSRPVVPAGSVKVSRHTIVCRTVFALNTGRLLARQSAFQQG